MTKVINFEENFPLNTPEIWYDFTRYEGEDIASHALTKIKFNDETQNQYYQYKNDKFPYSEIPLLTIPDNF